MGKLLEEVSFCILGLGAMAVFRDPQKVALMEPRIALQFLAEYLFNNLFGEKNALTVG